MASLHSRTIVEGAFEWDPVKDLSNQIKHGVSFRNALKAFADPHAKISIDLTHSTHTEVREFLVGQVDGRVLTVRLTRRPDRIRIFCAGYWRKFEETYHAGH
jgi:uncharacterized protein